MTDIPHRRDINDPVIRALLEKLRGNALVIALQRLGGELIITDELQDAADGYAVMVTFTEDANAKFTIMRKP